MEYRYFSPSRASGERSEQPHKRGHERRSVKIWLAENHANAEQQALDLGSHCIMNLSADGAYVAGKPLRKNALIKMQFFLPNHHQPIRTLAKVAWSATAGEIANPEHEGMGVQFYTISQHDQQALSTYLYNAQPFAAPQATPRKNLPLPSPAPPPRSSHSPLAGLSEDEIEYFLLHGFNKSRL